MYILGSRCENVDFSEPIGVFGDAFIVAGGNPKGIQTYEDIRDKGPSWLPAPATTSSRSPSGKESRTRT